MTIWEKLFLSTTEKEEGDLASYLRRLEDGSFVDRLVYGVAEEKRGFLALDPVQQPGALYCGGMGSGKSVAMRFTVVTHFVCNSENTFYIMIDPLKGMTDYAPLFKYKKNVAKALNDTAKLVPAIKMLYQECMARKEAFSEINANSIYTYEAHMRKQDPNFPGLARIMVCMEEFHSVPVANEVKYHMNVDRPGTVAAMLKELMRVGRSYGICLLAATQRATSDDFPSSLKPGITQLMAFKVNNPGDATAINLAHAADIRSEQRGRCAYEGGFIQFPFLDTPDCEKLLERNYKPLKAKLLRHSVEKYQEAFAGEGNAGMTKVEPIKSLLENLNSFKVEDVASRILESFDFETSSQGNSAYVANLIAHRDGKKYGVYLVQSPDQSSAKALDALKKGLKHLDCDAVVIINFGKAMMSGGGGVDGVVKEVGGYAIDGEDIGRIAQVLDNKDRLEREGKYEQLYNELALIRKKEHSLKKEEVEAPKDEPKEAKKQSTDDIFAELDNLLVKKKPDAAKVTPEVKASLKVEPKAETKVSPSVESFFDDLVKKDEPKKEAVEAKPEEKDEVKVEESEEEFKRPVAKTGGSSLINLREKLRASMMEARAREIKSES